MIEEIFPIEKNDRPSRRRHERGDRLFRKETTTPPQFNEADEIVMPVPAAGEFYAGVYSSTYIADNLAIVDGFLSKHTFLGPDHAHLRTAAQAISISGISKSMVCNL